MTSPINGPLRLSDIKYAIYGGLRADRVLYAGWSLTPSIGLVAKDINRLGLEFENFAEPLELSVAYMADSIDRNFAAGGRPEPWEPLAEYTKQVRGNDGPILIRTGNLRRAATSFSIWAIGPTSASIRQLPSNVWYGAVHQAGYGSLMDVARKMLGGSASPRQVSLQALSLFTRGRTPSRQSKIVIPQREFIVFQVEDIEAVQEIFIDWMEDQADQVGRSWNAL